MGRPNNVPQAAPIIAAIQEEAKKYPRIYVTSIHKDLTCADVRRYGILVGVCMHACDLNLPCHGVRMLMGNCMYDELYGALADGLYRALTL